MQNQLNQQIHSYDTANCKVSKSKWSYLLTIPILKLLKYLLAFLNLHQHSKVSSFHKLILEILGSILGSNDQAGQVTLAVAFYWLMKNSIPQSQVTSIRHCSNLYEYVIAIYS